MNHMPPQKIPENHQAQPRNGNESGMATNRPTTATMTASITKAMNRRIQCSCRAGLWPIKSNADGIANPSEGGISEKRR